MNKHASLLLVFIMFRILNVGVAQKQSELHLKNGSIIYGTIIQNIPDSIVKIKTKCENVLVFEHQNIQNISLIKYKPEPYSFTMDVGIAGFGGSYDASFSFLVIATYRLTGKSSVGILSGVEYFNIPLLPLAAEFRTDLFKQNISPYVYLRGGYGLKMISDEKTETYTASYKGGLMFGGGIGIKKRFSSEFAMSFSIGYRHQQTYEARNYFFDDWWNSDYERNYYNNRATFRVGFIF